MFINLANGITKTQTSYNLGDTMHQNYIIFIMPITVIYVLFNIQQKKGPGLLPG